MVTTGIKIVYTDNELKNIIERFIQIIIRIYKKLESLHKNKIEKKYYE